jgi:NTP pyrophosphatase (non-canonical NTP hydrolase)
MNLSKTLSDLKKIDEYFKVKYPELKNEIKTMARTIKLQEEAGEFCGEILAHLGYQREDKLSKMNKESLESEWADTFNALVLLAIHLDLDIEKILGKRMEIIKKRMNIE